MAKLTIKQKAFCEEYVANFGNGTQAAIKAGYSKAAETAYENLRKPHIKEYIKSLSERVNKERIMSVEEALAISTSIARGQPLPFVYKEIDPETNEVLIFQKKEASAGTKERNQALEHIYKVNMAFEKTIKDDDADIDWSQMVLEAEEELNNE